MSPASRSPIVDVTVVIPSHNRPLRLLWLLNALEAQTLDPERWDVVVVHDSSGPETEALLDDHPLRTRGRLRHMTFAPRSASPSAKRNAGWRSSKAALIAFTDDDCRPDPGWLETLLERHHQEPDAVLQGSTTPDPYEEHLLQAVVHARSQRVDPPNMYAQTCNIAYPRRLLELVDGFDELGPVPAGEDTDLFLRCEDQAAARLCPVPDAVVHHAVEPLTLIQTLRFTRRWEHLALLVKRHPRLRHHLTYGVFWKPRHPLALLALVGVATAARRPLVGLVLTLPWCRAAGLHLPRSPRQMLRLTRRLGSSAAIDIVEIAVLARGSVRYRTLYL